jgi:two-component system, NarL family, response regulator LiaR
VLVDDVTEMRRLVAEFLEARGCIVVGQAADGRAALELLERQPCDVVVMDYVMPVMDGLTAIREIGRRWPELHVVAFTSADDPAIVDHLLRAGAAAHVVKENIEGLVAHVVGHRPAASARAERVRLRQAAYET